MFSVSVKILLVKIILFMIIWIKFKAYNDLICLIVYKYFFFGEKKHWTRSGIEYKIISLRIIILNKTIKLILIEFRMYNLLYNLFSKMYIIDQ